MKTVLQLLAALAFGTALSAWAQEFPQNLVLDCKAGKQFINVELGAALSDGKGGMQRKDGMVGLRWGGAAKPVWAKPEKQADGSFKVVFAGRKPMSIKQTRKPTEESDYEPFLTIQEEGGKAFACGYAAG